MNKVNMTFLPSVRDDFSKDQLIIDWSEKLKDTFDFINIYIPKNILNKHPVI